jgi:hypothetical protein
MLPCQSTKQIEKSISQKDLQNPPKSFLPYSIHHRIGIGVPPKGSRNVEHFELNWLLMIPAKEGTS